MVVHPQTEAEGATEKALTKVDKVVDSTDTRTILLHVSPRGMVTLEAVARLTLEAAMTITTTMDAVQLVATIPLIKGANRALQVGEGPILVS